MTPDTTRWRDVSGEAELPFLFSGRSLAIFLLLRYPDILSKGRGPSIWGTGSVATCPTDDVSYRGYNVE